MRFDKDQNKFLFLHTGNDALCQRMDSWRSNNCIHILCFLPNYKWQLVSAQSKPITMWTKNILHLQGTNFHATANSLKIILMVLLNSYWKHWNIFIHCLCCIHMNINPGNATDIHVNLVAMSMHIDLPHWIFGRFLPGKLYVHCHHYNLPNKKKTFIVYNKVSFSIWTY